MTDSGDAETAAAGGVADVESERSFGTASDVPFGRPATAGSSDDLPHPAVAHTINIDTSPAFKYAGRGALHRVEAIVFQLLEFWERVFNQKCPFVTTSAVMRHHPDSFRISAVS